MRTVLPSSKINNSFPGTFATKKSINWLTWTQDCHQLNGLSSGAVCALFFFVHEMHQFTFYQCKMTVVVVANGSKGFKRAFCVMSLRLSLSMDRLSFPMQFLRNWHCLGAFLWNMVKMNEFDNLRMPTSICSVWQMDATYDCNLSDDDKGDSKDQPNPVWLTGSFSRIFFHIQFFDRQKARQCLNSQLHGNRIVAIDSFIRIWWIWCEFLQTQQESIRIGCLHHYSFTFFFFFVASFHSHSNLRAADILFHFDFSIIYS